MYADSHRVYVTDIYINPPSIPSARLFIFNRSTQTVSVLRVTSPPGSVSGEGALLAPSGIAAGAAGVIFVSDSALGRVFAYDLNGLLLMVLGAHGCVHGCMSGNGSAVLSSPSALAIDNLRNRLYVADSPSQRIKVYDSMGLHLLDIGNSGLDGQDFKFPSAVSVDRAGNIYVVDGLRRRIHIYDQEGVFSRVFTLEGFLPGQSLKPSGIAVDSDGHIYVADFVNNNVLIFTQEGKLIGTWGRTGSLIGDFWTPTGIFIDDRDYIYIADQNNGRVQTFQYVKLPESTR